MRSFGVYFVVSLNKMLIAVIWKATVPEVPIDSMSALVEVMQWRKIGGKPLPEPALTQIYVVI